MWCDVSEFTTAAESGRLAQAIDLYRGDLLPGFHLPQCGDFQMWLESERAVALERVVAAAWALARASEEIGNLTDAGGWARMAARHSWADERVLRRALLMLDRLGDRAGATKLFDSFARRLRTESDAAPSRETLDLAERLRST